MQQWEKQYEAGQLTQAAGRRSVSPEQAEITRLEVRLHSYWIANLTATNDEQIIQDGDVARLNKRAA